MKILIVIISIAITMSSCSQSQSLGPGYEFDLFKNTPNWQLAQAVNKEDTDAISHILKNGGTNINFQEPQYGNTVLSLAISNGKLLSVKTLLEYGANMNLKDSDHFEGIHVATDMISLRKNVPEILEMLLQHGADPNMVTNSTISYVDTSHFYLPLMGAVENLKCTQLLLDHGANLYYKKGETYPIWQVLLMLDIPNNENILVAKYLIVDQHMPIPDPIFYTIPNHQPRGALYLLNKFNVYNDPKKEQAKQEILDYLKKINFPQNGIYKEK